MPLLEKNVLKAFKSSMKTTVKFLLSGKEEQVSLWYESCNRARFHFDKEVGTLSSMILLGFDPNTTPGPLYKSTAMHMAASEFNALPLLKWLVTVAPESALIVGDENTTPLAVAASWQNAEGVEALANISDVEYRGEGHERVFSVLSLAASSLNTECLELVLKKVKPETVVLDCSRCLTGISDFWKEIEKRQENGLAQTADFQGTGLYKIPAFDRAVRMINMLVNALPALDLIPNRERWQTECMNVLDHSEEVERVRSLVAEESDSHYPLLGAFKAALEARVLKESLGGMKAEEVSELPAARGVKSRL